ncbi:Uncharacterized protein C1834.10c [Coccomyxa sp. Obi]|nr:Uncharacterized protein C1834.10c [Coccomyxa sp. Obi]
MFAIHLLSCPGKNDSGIPQLPCWLTAGQIVLISWCRFLVRSVAKTGDQPAVKSDDIVTYEGPLKQAVLSLKKLSLFSCAATFAMSPVMLLFDTSATSLGAKASIAVTLCSFGIFTTGLLHWFTSPYVRRLVYDRKSETLEIETLSVFARPQITRTHLSEIAYPDTIRPQVTFAVKRKFFYLDADRFPDKALLAALTPPEPSAAGTIPH